MADVEPMWYLLESITPAEQFHANCKCTCVHLLQGAWDNNGMADFHTPVGGAADEAELQRALESMLQA